MDKERWQHAQRWAMGLMIVGMIVVGGGAFVSDTAGFSSIASERDMTVANSDDDLNALLKVSADGSKIEDGDFNEPLVINFTNQYNSNIDVTVAINETSGTSLTVGNFSGTDEQISADGSKEFATSLSTTGDTNDLNVTVDDTDANSTIRVTVTSEFDGTTQEFTRQNVTVRG